MTARRQVLRPIPLTLIGLFIAIAVLDFVEWWRSPPTQIPDLLRNNTLLFEPVEPVVDLRPAGVSAEVGMLPTASLEDGPWLKRGTHGVWFTGNRATVELTLREGKQQKLVFQCRPAGGKKPVKTLAVVVNEIDCGFVDLEPGWGWYTLSLPEGAVRAGRNRLTFSTPDRQKYCGSRRTVRFRRLALLSESGRNSDALKELPDFEIDLENDSFTIHQPGWLTIPFSVDGRIDALVFRYRFRRGSGRAEVLISRPQGTGPGLDAPVRRFLNSDQTKKGRIRLPLHGHRGQYVLSIGVELESRRGRLEIENLQLVKE